MMKTVWVLLCVVVVAGCGEKEVSVKHIEQQKLLTGYRIDTGNLSENQATRAITMARKHGAGSTGKLGVIKFECHDRTSQYKIWVDVTSADELVLVGCWSVICSTSREQRERDWGSFRSTVARAIWEKRKELQTKT